MTLWEYLKSKIIKYSERLAFPEAGISYSDILNYEVERGNNWLEICFGERRIDQAIAILRCMAKGNIPVPLSVDYGMERFQLLADMIKADTNRYDDLAFIMFTSGTTSIPKGIMLTHANIITNLEYINSYFKIDGLKRICIGRPLVHVAVLVGELLFGLINGLQIYFYEESYMPHLLLKYLNDRKIEIFCSTPTMYYALAQTKISLPIQVSAISGERLTETVANIIASRFPQTQFYNVYGLTEHSPRVSALMPKDFLRKCGSIGKPIGNVRMEISDRELKVKSPCIMKGYYNKECNCIRNGWLYTGDSAHCDEEGYFYIDGRKDDMIIRAGVNIFPQEIESVLKKCHGVEECLVYGVDDIRYGQKICVEYKGDVEESDLRRYAVKQLPAYMVPMSYRKKDRFQYTLSGKLIRGHHGC